MKKNKLSNHKQHQIGMVPFPPLPGEAPPLPQPRATNRVPLIMGIIVSLGLTALLSFTVPWGPVSQAFTGTLGALYVQVKQIQFPQIKLPKRAQSAPEVSTPATQTTETSPTPDVATPVTPATEPPPTTPIPEPDLRLLVGRYPVRKYTDIRRRISPGDGLYQFIREYRDQIFPKKYRDWQQLAQYNDVPPPQYILNPGDAILIPTLAPLVLPKTGYETELQQIQSELANQPDNPELLNQRAIIHFKRNELNRARSTLRRGVKSSPNNSVLHNNLGFIYLILEDNKLAQNEFERAITHSEKPAIPHCNLGTLYMTMGKLDLAIEAFERALEADVNLLDAKYNLALAHEKIGKVDSAREYLRELAQISPDDAEVESALERLTSTQVMDE